MKSHLVIYTDRLKHEEIENIKESVSPASLEMPEEQELSFREPITISGEAYLASEHLIIHLKIKTTVLIPCSICNNPILQPLSIDNFYHSIPIDELASPIYDYSPEIREALLIQVPAFAECHEGKCPERQVISKYLKKPDIAVSKKDDTETFFPFADLDKK